MSNRSQLLKALSVPFLTGISIGLAFKYYGIEDWMFWIMALLICGLGYLSFIPDKEVLNN